MNYSEVIVKPLLTEKTSILTETENTYCFEVLKAANKNQIKIAVEKLFDVKVLGVNTSIESSREKRFGKFMTRSSGAKKAFVQIEKGQKIELFKSI